MDKLIPADWFDRVFMERVHVHWTAGPAQSRPDEAEHYHMILNQDLTLRKGVPIKLNAYSGAPLAGYAAHTLGANRRAIGYSMAGMRGAVESPFNPGPDPITEPQWNRMVIHVAQLCKFYKIEVGPTTVLTHAEVTQNLGIKQKGKWDISILPWQSKEWKNAGAIGNLLRSEVQQLLDDGELK
jgi:hypothetical protein